MTASRLLLLSTGFLGRLVGGLLYWCAYPQRRIVGRNLAFALPELTRRERRRIARAVFRNYGCVLVETILSGWFSLEEIRRRVALNGGERFAQAAAAGRGVLAVSAHIGNWELALHGMPGYFGRPLTAVAKRFKSDWIEKRLHARRTRFGNTVLYKKGSLVEMTRVLRAGGVLVMMVDMARRKDGIEVEFFGKRATATPAAAMLALRCRAPVVPAFSHRDPDGRIIVSCGEPIEMRRSGDLRADLRENTQRITAAVEQAVRAHPGQWHWMMKRWKDYYPDLYK
jgi:KDO2-lipid IV(A) lauroyltransferase